MQRAGGSNSAWEAREGSRRLWGGSDSSYLYLATPCPVPIRENDITQACNSDDENPGNTALLDTDDSDAADAGNDGSGDAVARRIRMAEEDRVDITDKVAEVIYSIRYCVTVGPLSSVVTVWWRKSEKERLWHKYTTVKLALARGRSCYKFRGAQSSSLSAQACALWLRKYYVRSKFRGCNFSESTYPC